MFQAMRVYDYQPPLPAVLVDRLWPRGISQVRLAGVEWAKDVTPSTGLRQWFHQDPAARYDEFCQRYRAELAQPEIQPALQALRDMQQQHGTLILLTAAKALAPSQVPVWHAVLERKPV